MSEQETRLREITERVNAATEGPWHWNETTHIVYDDQPERVTFACFDGDSAFIAHAREDVPWLLEALRAVGAERDAAVKALERIAVWVRDGLDEDPDGVQLARSVFETATDALASLSAAGTEPGGEA